MANRVGGSIVLPAPAPPEQRVGVRRFQMPAAPVLTAPAQGQLRRSAPALTLRWRGGAFASKPTNSQRPIVSTAGDQL